MIRQSKISRRSFLKTVGAGTAAMSLSSAINPWWGYAQDPIVFGLADPFTGPIAFFGLSAQASAGLAIAEINAAGGIDGRPITLEIEDTQGRPDQAALAMQALGDRADFLMGLFTSESALASLPSLAQIRKPFMSTGAATPLTTIQVSSNYDNLKYYFRVGPLNSIFLIDEFVEFGQKVLVDFLNWENVVILAEDAEWNRPITDGLAALGIPPISTSFESIGLGTNDVVRYAVDTTDFSGIYSQAEATGADGFFTLQSTTGVAPVLQWAQIQPKMPLAGVNVLAQLGVFNQLTGGVADSVSTITTSARAFITEKTIPYYDAIAQAAPDLPLPAYPGPVTYDAVYILKEAIERAGTTDADAVVTSLEATDYTGVVGQIQFFPPGAGPFTHDLIHVNPATNLKNVAGIWVQWQGGEQKVIFPVEATLGNTGTSFLNPPWMRV